MADEVAKFTFDVSPELLVYVDMFCLYVQFRYAVPPERIWDRSLSLITSVGTDSILIQGAYTGTQMGADWPVSQWEQSMLKHQS